MAGMDEYNRGNLVAYIELLKTGIRNICLPNANADKKTHINYVDKEAKKNGFYTLLVTFNRTTSDGGRFKSYQRIVYCLGRKAAAKQLREILQKTSKDKSDHEMIGKLLGYNRKAITSFINEK